MSTNIINYECPMCEFTTIDREKALEHEEECYIECNYCHDKELGKAIWNLRRYTEKINQENNICNCICCMAIFPPKETKRSDQTDWKKCLLRNQIYQMLNEHVNNIEFGGNDLHTDYMSFEDDYQNFDRNKFISLAKSL